MAVSEERYEVEDEFESHLDDEEEDSSTKPAFETPSIWQTIRRFFYKTAEEKDEDNRTRMYILNQAIETYPTAAVNYLLRGELHLELKHYAYAEEDFEQAIELATTQFENERWGLGSQAIQDRARRSLQRIVR